MIDQIFREYGDEYLNHFIEDIPFEHIKVIRAIQRCRTEFSGINTYQCKKCETHHSLFRSCGNRNCPVCQYQKGNEWLDKRMKEQLPGAYFMVTFTIPKEMRGFMRTSQKKAYNIFFKAASDTLKLLMKNPKFVGGDLPGFFAVLHTWGRQIQYHPHIHFVVPGGALCTKTGEWKRAQKGFLAPIHALSKVFRAKFRDEMKKLNIKNSVDPDVWKKSWNVNSQYIPNGSSGAIKYLAPYVFKVGISNSRIIKVENRRVFFKYKKQRSSKVKTMNLDIMEFIRRFLQHVLPTGFMKVRYYGFMGSGCKITTKQLTAKIAKSYDYKVRIPQYVPSPKRPPMKCDKCGGELELIMIEKDGFTIDLDAG